MNKTGLFLTASLIAGFSSQAFAQEPDMRTEIDVERTVVPIERNASPIVSASPSIFVPEAQTYTLKLTDYSSPSEYDNVIKPLPAVSYSGLKGMTPYRGYLSLGYFPLFNAGISAGYKVLQTEKTSLGLWMQYDGYNYKAHGSFPITKDESHQNVRDNTVTVGADFSQSLGRRTRLSLSANYTYGSQIQPFLSGTPETDGERRSISGFNARLGIYGGIRQVGWHFGGEFDHFSQGKDLLTVGIAGMAHAVGASENRTFFHTGGIWQMNRNSNLGLEVSADFLHRCRGLLVRPLENNHLNIGTPDKATTGIIKIQPSYGFHRSGFSLRLGADLNIATVSAGSHIHVNPNALIDWNLSSKVALYARFEGGDYFNSLRFLYSEAGSFAPGSYVYTSANTPINTRFGVNFGSFGGFSLELFGRYADTHNAAMPALIDCLSAVSGGFITTDISGWGAGAKISWLWRDKVNFRAGFEYLASGYASGFADNLDRAKTITDVRVDVNATSKLTLGAGYELRTGRHFYRFVSLLDGQFERSRESMKNVSNLSLNANYRITEALSAFIRVENLLCRRAETLPWVPGQTIHGLFGATLKF